MGDDREFDRMLEEELTALPLPDDTVAEVNPWRRAMVRIVWGTGLTTLTLNFWYLNYLLPAVGVVLLFLGFRTLRRENRWFALCWGLSLLDLASFYVGRVMDATIWARDLPPLGVALALLGLVRSFCLWRGIRAVRRCAGQEDRAGAAAALLAFQCALVALGLLGGGNLQGAVLRGSFSGALHLHHAQPGEAARPAGWGGLRGAGRRGAPVRTGGVDHLGGSPDGGHPGGGDGVLPLPHGVEPGGGRRTAGAGGDPGQPAGARWRRIWRPGIWPCWRGLSA